ncbi:ribosomal-processing cysteine protease Prp [Crassaminicella thermophila]|uniref:Ribosomal processing cysteine protease Prp n=1 Tax=Crassaminicella thermophila TaxID=2599308 RepID=A0A5C0SE46_CRATE|nr:ribosomal-processing cysteine protease Prp [Crassaminicella thermophila]QEK12036.1 ribosomal-processing cysteine protease Prp [Crassaminicella thermophila]
MIKIHIYRDQEKNIMQYSVEGHANAAEYGSDIVCASISILTQTTMLALYELLSIDIAYEIEDGWLYCKLPDNLSNDIREKANLILDTMIIGIKGTQGMYQEYIEFYDEEV